MWTGCCTVQQACAHIRPILYFTDYFKCCWEITLIASMPVIIGCCCTTELHQDCSQYLLVRYLFLYNILANRQKAILISERGKWGGVCPFWVTGGCCSVVISFRGGATNSFCRDLGTLFEPYCFRSYYYHYIFFKKQNKKRKKNTSRHVKSKQSPHSRPFLLAKHRGWNCLAGLTSVWDLMRSHSSPVK